jgi:hypothetical protein
MRKRYYFQITLDILSVICYTTRRIPKLTGNRNTKGVLSVSKKFKKIDWTEGGFGKINHEPARGIANRLREEQYGIKVTKKSNGQDGLARPVN